MDPNVQNAQSYTQTETTQTPHFFDKVRALSKKTKIFIFAGVTIVFLAVITVVLGGVSTSQTNVKKDTKSPELRTLNFESLNASVLWSVADNTNDSTLQEEVKNAFVSFHPDLKNGVRLEVFALHLSSENPAYGVASMRARDKVNKVISSDGFEFLVNKTSGTWVITPRGASDFCTILSNMPEDLISTRRNMYTECFNSEGH